MPDLVSEWPLETTGRLYGSWVFADFANAVGSTAPSHMLRGRIICKPAEDMVVTEGSTVGEIWEQSQVVSEEDATVDFFLAPGKWRITMEIWQLRIVDGVAPELWPGEPLKYRVLPLYVEAGEMYDLAHIAATTGLGCQIGVAWSRTDHDSVIMLSGEGVYDENEDSTMVALTGFGVHDMGTALMLTNERRLEK